MKMGNIRASLLITICLCWPVFTRVLPEATVNETNAVLAASNIFPTLPIVLLGSANEKCRSDSQLLLDNLHKSTTWAAQMLDASAKSAEGIYVGSTYQFGNFDECINTEIPIQGQYCLATLTLKPPASQPINHSPDIYRPFGSIWDKIGHDGDRARVARNVVHYGLCIPASCSHSDLEESIRRHLAATPSNNTIRVEVPSKLCHTSRKEEVMTNSSIAFCILVASICLLVLLCTFCDNNTYSLQGGNKEQDTKLQRPNSYGYVQCFSLKRNVFDLCKYSQSTLGSIYGMKFISTCGVITAHRQLLATGSPLENYEYFEKAHADYTVGVHLQYEAVVDTFFLLSGILLAFVMFRMLQKNTLNPIMLIIQRYMRLTPVYAVVVFFAATLMYHLGDGPLWIAMVGTERQYCVQNWWTNILYVNNYVHDDQMCLLHSWYMAPEFHFYVTSTFLIILIHKHPKSGYVALGILTAMSLIVPFAITYLHHMDPVQFFYHDVYKNVRTQPYFRHMYSKSHVHATPYLVGVTTGLILHRLRSHEVKYTWQSTLGLVAGFLISYCSLVPGAFMINQTWNYSDTFAALEQPQRRLFWPLGIALMIISLRFNQNGIINKVLSSRLMFFLSKLTYSAYLVSFCFQLIDAGTVIGLRQLTLAYQIRSSVSDICIAFTAAFVLYLIIEAPTENLLKKVLTRESEKESSKA